MKLISLCIDIYKNLVGIQFEVFLFTGKVVSKWSMRSSLFNLMVHSVREIHILQFNLMYAFVILRFSALSLHFWYRVPYISIKHQWSLGTTSSFTLNHSKGFTIHWSWNQCGRCKKNFNSPLTSIANHYLSFHKDGSERPMESLSLIDAVMPDVVASRQQQLQNNQKVVKTEPPNSNGDDPMHSYRKKSWLDLLTKNLKKSNEIHFFHLVANPTEGREEESGVEIPASKATVLRGHESEVFICAWNPTTDLLASGSGDSTARIWNMNDNSSSPTQLVLRHCIQKGGTEVPSNKDVTSLDWNVRHVFLSSILFFIRCKSFFPTVLRLIIISFFCLVRWNSSCYWFLRRVRSHLDYRRQAGQHFRTAQRTYFCAQMEQKRELHSQCRSWQSMLYYFCSIGTDCDHSSCFLHFVFFSRRLSFGTHPQVNARNSLLFIPHQLSM